MQVGDKRLGAAVDACAHADLLQERDQPVVLHRVVVREDLADVAEGHLSSALCHLGNVSHRLGETQGKDAVLAAAKGDRVLAEACERMIDHLEANDVDLDRTRLCVGARLDVDPTAESFVGNAAAQQLRTRDYRAGFAVPTEV